MGHPDPATPGRLTAKPHRRPLRRLAVAVPENCQI